MDLAQRIQKDPPVSKDAENKEGGTKTNEFITYILKNPDYLGRKVGFKDLQPMHGDWIREMING